MTISVDEVELEDLRRDYLADVGEKVELLHHHGPTLTTPASFKAAFPLLLYVSHQLKGSGGSLGYPRISALAAELNRELNRFLDVGASRPAPQELSTAVLRIATELDAELERAGSSQPA